MAPTPTAVFGVTGDQSEPGLTQYPTFPAAWLIRDMRYPSEAADVLHILLAKEPKPISTTPANINDTERTD